jgi:Domain of unknown function (DUF4430)
VRTRGLCLLALLAAGCGGATSGDVTVTVSRDFGETHVAPTEQNSASGNDTVLQLLQRDFTVKAPGGGVREIEGLSGGEANGRKVGWFYYVNGIAASRAGDRRLHPGDKVWWDHHDAQTAATVPAVVGAFPEPFASGSEGKKLPIRLVCLGGGDSCDEVEQRLQDAGVKAIARSNLEQSVGEVLRILVGPWSEVRKDIAARTLETGPSASGVFAKPDPSGAKITLLDSRGEAGKTLGRGTGLVAATTFEDQRPTWLITGTDAVGVDAAAAALTAEQLDDHFAVAIEAGQGIALPLKP